MGKKQAYFWNDWLSDPDLKSSLRHRGSWLLTHLQLKKEKWKKFGHLHVSYQTSQPFLLMESVTYLRWYFQIKKKKTMNSSTLDRAACTSYSVHSKAEQKVATWHPKKKEDYIAITGAERFPLFFHSTLWLEDTIVSARLTGIWDSVIRIVRYG